MIVSTLRRTCTVTAQEEWDKRSAALLARLTPYLQTQPGFVAHELRRDSDGGAMVETTWWRSEDDCRAFLRGGAAAMASTWLDAFLPTAPFPNGNWVRETIEQL
jgi:Antibiotic biosynthesis monooxygenase